MQNMAGDSPRPCPQCAAPMAQRRLHAHSGRPVMVDHCAPCRLVWFDALESVQLSGLGWVELLRELTRDEAFDRTPQRPPTMACPVCSEPLKPVHNRSRWGRFPALECPRRHGHLHSDAGALAERGLVRTLLPAERGAIRAQQRVLHCFGCGAAADGDGENCGWCASPLLVIDLPRLAHSLRQRGPGGDAMPRADGTPLRWPCRSCGTALDPSRTAACPQCGTGVIAPALSDLKPMLDAVEPGLRSAAHHPPKPKRHVPVRRGWRETTLARILDWFRPR